MRFAVRSRFDWRLRTRTLQLGRRTLLMGILNVTPDSFSDGGKWLGSGAALTHGLEMLDEGADILDLGAESTRPNATAVPPEEEQSRLMPVLRAILSARPGAILSIDTYHAGTARMAIEAGAEIVNDVSGGLWDREMAGTCASLGCGVILTHTRGRPQEWQGLPALPRSEVMPMVMRDLRERASEAMAAGVAREAIVLDPGFGFGKALDENYTLLGHLDELHGLELPVIAGVSRKGFLKRAVEELFSGATTVRAAGDAAGQLADATTAANTAGILAGAHILRVHEVRSARAAAAMADRILNRETS